MQKILTFFLAIVMAILTLPSTVLAQSDDQQQTMLILDASGSMWGQIDGTAKIAIAREVIDGLLDDWDPSVSMGLMAYGHREKGNCGDIETLIPVGAVRKSDIMTAVNALNPKGKTPITASIRRAADILKYSEEKATVILVSDGLETCDADPCALATELEAKGVDFTAHVVGFDVKKEESQQLQCIANNTGGKYFSAASAAELTDALTETVATVRAAPPEPQGIRARAKLCETCDIFTSLGFRWSVFPAQAADNAKPIQQAVVPNNFFKLDVGRYRVRLRVGYASAEEVADVSENKSTNVVLNLNAGVLKPQAFMIDGGDLLDGYKTSYKVFQRNADGSRGERVHNTSNGGDHIVLPAGAYVLETKHGGYAFKETPFEITAGEDTVPITIMNTGVLKPRALMIEGGDPLTAYKTSIKIFERKADGSRGARIHQSSNGTDNVVLPANQYVLETTHGYSRKEMPFDIIAGEATETTTIMNSGVLQPRAFMLAGGDVLTAYSTSVQLFPVKEDGTEGPRLHNSSNGASAVVVPAGDYILRTKHGYGRKETSATVVAGETVVVETIMETGVVRPKAFMVEGGDQLTGYATAVQIFVQREDGTEGPRIHNTSAGAQAVVLPEGRYSIRTRHGYANQENSFVLQRGEDISVETVMNSGVLTPQPVAEPGGSVLSGYATSVEIFAVEGGERRRIHRSSSGASTVVLPAGEYIIKQKYGEVVKETPISIKAGDVLKPIIVMQ